MLKCRAVGLTAAAVIGVLSVAAPASAPATVIPVSKIGVGGGNAAVVCVKYWHQRVGTDVVIRDDWWGRWPVCIENDHTVAFTVTRSAIPAHHPGVAAFPYVFIGCSWGICSRHSFLPARVTAVRNPVATFSTRGNPRGGWNAAYEMWFATHRETTGQADGAELMVWLRAPGWDDSRKIVHVGGRAYFLAHWVDLPGHAGPGTPGWQYIQFKLVRPRYGVRNLHLGPLIRYCERRGWIRPSWWMLNIEAGFEIRWGGRGLAETGFSATPLCDLRMAT